MIIKEICRVLALAVIWCWATPQLVADSSLAFCFSTGETGGVATVTLSAASNKLNAAQVVFEREDCRQPLKVRRTPNGDFAVCTNLQERGRQLFIWSAADPSKVKALALKAIPDELRLTPDVAIVTCDDNSIRFVDLKSAKVLLKDKIETTLTPSGNGPEDIHLTADLTSVVITLQKDHRSGTKLGNRIIIYQLPERARTADLRLPRDHPELHIEGNLKEQGPGPEVALVSASIDTLAVSLDLYGAIGFAKWSAARKGKLTDWELVSTALDGTWGSAFPDRMTQFDWKGRPHILVCNAGPLGGCVLIDVQQRKIVNKQSTPPGLEAPLIITSLGKAYSVCSGKTKRRSATDVIKSSAPQSLLFEFDLPAMFANSTTQVKEIPLPGVTSQIAVMRADPPALLIACGESPDAADQLILFDPRRGRILDQQASPGVIGRFEN